MDNNGYFGLEIRDEPIRLYSAFQLTVICALVPLRVAVNQEHDMLNGIYILVLNKIASINCVLNYVTIHGTQI